MSNSDIVSSRLQLIRRLVSNIVVKQEKRAAEYETEELYMKFQEYRYAVEELDTLSDYDDFIYEDIRVTFPKLPEDTVNDLMNGTDTFENLLSQGIITKEEYDYFLYINRVRRISEYEEGNDYYRMLLGLPPIDTPESDYIYVLDNIPIHEITQLEYYKLKRSGKIDVIISENPDKPYLKYIGKNINIFDARMAEEFEVLWTLDNPENTVYRDIFNRERKVFLRTYHHEHLCYSSDYNEAYELTTLKLRAAIYYIIEMQSPSLSRSTFTKEESEELFKEYGLSFPKNMPSSYRDAISFVLSYMVMWKGTNYAVQYIADKIFSGLKLYKYFIRKRQKEGVQTPIPPDTPPDQVYDVDFIMRPYNATNVIDFKDDERDDVIMTYDDVVQLDPRWRDSDELKKAVFSEQFSYVESKYISLDNNIDISDFTSALSTMTRIIVENKEHFSKYNFVYSVTGIDHSFYNLWIYFIALYTSAIEQIRVQSPDTLSRINKLFGFVVPQNIATIKIYWIWYLRMSPLKDALNNFPDVMNNDDDFFELLLYVDKAIGMAKVLDEVMTKANTFQEVKLILDVYRLVRIRNVVPEAYDMSVTTVEGKTYTDYLETADENLFLEYERVFSHEDPNILILEVDNIVQTLLSIVGQTENEMFQFNNIKNGLNQANMMIGGISKYLIYVIKLFKAYTVDFITDTNIHQMSPESNYNVNIDQMYTEIDYTEHDRWNMSQYDWLVVERNDDFVDKNIGEKQISTDEVIMETYFGETKIS